MIRPVLLDVILAIPMFSADRLTLLALGVLAIWFAIRGISTGEVPLKFSTLKRSDGELLFWFGIGMNIFIGSMLLLDFIFGRDIWK